MALTAAERMRNSRARKKAVREAEAKAAGVKAEQDQAALLPLADLVEKHVEAPSAAVRGRPVGTLLNNPWDAEESKAAGFIHLLDAWKRDPGYEAKVAARLEREFPAIHNHIEHLA